MRFNFYMDVFADVNLAAFHTSINDNIFKIKCFYGLLAC